jgi:hypothetical protein
MCPTIDTKSVRAEVYETEGYLDKMATPPEYAHQLVIYCLGISPLIIFCPISNMIALSDIQTALPKSCEVQTPLANDTVESYLSDRWMSLGPSTLPAATVVPSTEGDIVAAVGFAAENDLKVIPKCGGLGGLVLVNNKTLYLDMKNFTDIKVDSEHRSVTVGGGALVKQVLKTVLASGFYTGKVLLCLITD